MTELRPLSRVAKMCAAHKNDLNLPITSPISKILSVKVKETSFIR